MLVFFCKKSLLEIYNEKLFGLSPIPNVGEGLQMFDDPINKTGVTGRITCTKQK